MDLQEEAQHYCLLQVEADPVVRLLQSELQIAAGLQFVLLVQVVALVIKQHVHDQLPDNHCRSTKCQRYL